MQLLKELLEDEGSFTKQTITVNGHRLKIKTADEFFILCALLADQMVNIVLRSGKTVENVVMKGSFSTNNGPNSWLVSDGEKVWCQAFMNITVPDLDKATLDKKISSVSEKLETRGVTLSQYDAHFKKLDPGASKTRSMYESSFLEAVKTLASVVGKSPLAAKKILSPGTKTLH